MNEVERSPKCKHLMLSAGIKGALGAEATGNGCGCSAATSKLGNCGCRELPRTAVNLSCNTLVVRKIVIFPEAPGAQKYPQSVDIGDGRRWGGGGKPKRACGG